MKLYNINKPQNLFKKLDECEGAVRVIMPDGNECKWEEDGQLVKSLWTTMPDRKLDNVELKLGNKQDTMKMIDFLMRGNCA
jgi:hypothetical protein